MTDCIDLKDRFGRRYRVVCEESYAAERGEHGRAHDPWLLTIPCQHGHVYPHGDGLLGASTDRRGKITNRLAALSCVREQQDGDDGLNAVFDVDNFDEVATIMKPKRRRKLSPEHRAKLTEAGTRALARHRNSNDAHRDRRRDPRPLPDSQAV